MTISQAGWREVEALHGADLKNRVFSILQETALEIQTHQSDDPAVLNVVPRLATLLDQRPELDSFREAFGSLARSVGLWN